MIPDLRNTDFGHGVRIRDIRVYRAHNTYATMPVFRAVMDIGRYVERPSSDFPGFNERLMEWLPGLMRHECSVGRPGGFFERLQRGTYLPHIAEHVCLELQNAIGFDVRFGRARGTGTEGVYQVLVQYVEAAPALKAFETALRLVLAGMHAEPFDPAAEFEGLRRYAEEYAYGPSTGAVVQAARRRGIPVIRLTPKGSLVQLGYGIAQKRIQATETSGTSSIAVTICQEKPMTNRLLNAVGVPVPEGQSVRTADEAWQAARDIGRAVVLKPESGNQGKGVAVNLSSEAEVRDAFAAASRFDPVVLVERYIRGSDYRLLVVDGKLTAAARREPAQVTGDGRSSVAQLVATVNRDPLRRPGHSGHLSRIRLDETADLVLAQQSLTRESVPEAGRIVRLRTNANLSTGGTAVDVTDDVHPQNARMAVLAARILALDVAGVDVVCEAIDRPLAEQDGAIVEVNAAPGLRMHLNPASGRPRPVGRAIVDMLFPDHPAQRIPIVTVTGTNGKTTVTRLIAHLFRTARRTVGMTTTDGIYIDGERIVRGDCSGPSSAEAVLLHPNVEAAVLEAGRGGILREGLGYDGCTVGVVTNISADHLGMGPVATLEDLARVKQVVVEAVHPTGAAVLNADDPLVAAMSASTKGEVIYFSRNCANPVVDVHAAGGGMCVCVRGGAMVLLSGGQATELIELERVPMTAGGRIGFQVENALAAVAAAWGARLNPAFITRGLTTFVPDTSSAPGRFNVMNIRGVEVVLDYGHNAGAMGRLGEALAALPRRRTVVLLTLPGDRRDEDLVATFKAAQAFADEIVLYDDKDLRGRAPGEIRALVAPHRIDGIPAAEAADAAEALRTGWELVQPGDRMVAIADDVDRFIQWLESVPAGASEDMPCEVPMGDFQSANGRASADLDR